MKKPIKWMSIFLISVLFFLSGGPAGGRKISGKERVDLIAAGGTIVTMDGERRIIEDGAIAVKGDAIVAVGKRAEIEAKYMAPRRIQAQGKLILPGLINGHTHAPTECSRSRRAALRGFSCSRPRLTSPTPSLSDASILMLFVSCSPK